MVLSNLTDVVTNKSIDLQLVGRRIGRISESRFNDSSTSLKLNFDNALVLPGLINSHDHLDFNLFPQFGHARYNNYIEWASNIHRSYKDEIAAVLQVPEELRVQWGIYKNLLGGITTVVNHGKLLPQKKYLITVLQSCQSLHSVAFERYLKFKLNNPFRLHKPVAIHTGEGTDKIASTEIDNLLKWNLFKRMLVGVHGVAMKAEQATKFKALVWCPASNYFMFGETVDISKVKEHTNICFGSDSTLTSDWNIWKHLRLAQCKSKLGDKEILDMLTVNPGRLWKLNGGVIKEGMDADILVAKKPLAGELFSLDPEDILLVIHKGRICLFDESLSQQLRDKFVHPYDFTSTMINSSQKFVMGNLPQLMTDIKAYLPNASFPCKPISNMQHNEI